MTIEEIWKAIADNDLNALVTMLNDKVAIGDLMSDTKPQRREARYSLLRDGDPGESSNPSIGA